ncbi:MULTISPECIES: BREX-1 system adenine-specific DNA-methyltransferase PglX [unclassified Stenotrophomonas]|uniref:BREX-1 system adenine-specific DNA-methyltransferase PglX n=1 Tax=unclassified Stenotrophomonas TaxID=196198 RepID=UPI003012ED00
MNTGNLKSYAPQARKDFIAAVTARANLLGLSDARGALQVAEAEVKNDIVMIAGRPWPVKVNEQRNTLIARMRLQGFGHTVEAVAYAWFNRLAALRYMEVHDYLGHGRRVLSNLRGGLPEVLAHALELAESNALPGLSADTVRELKLANKDPELYRLILIAQCNALHQAMPFLFEELGDETELLLPENLLLTDSVVAKMVQSIPEEDWQQIEIIGWLYQFYISEKKDQVIGKVVKSEDIPAATQLFTPNWIVKYMVQNSLGAQWLATYPTSSLRAQMEYYIVPAEQTDEVNAQLAAITPSSINPEELTLIDPACGSGHILVEAYDLFKAIYLERGYRQRDVAKLILEKNLFGLDIDERAAQLTGFALMMKARADDRRLFEREVKLNVMALMNSSGFDAEVLSQGARLTEYGLELGNLTALKGLFKHAETFGSLIQVPEELARKQVALKMLASMSSEDLFVSKALNQLRHLVRQAVLLNGHYDVVVANPPYMGGGGMNALVKAFAKENFPDAKSDLFACFIERGFLMARSHAFVSMVTMQGWMFLSSFENMRKKVLEEKTIFTMAQIGFNSFPSMNSKIALAAVFSALNAKIDGCAGTYVDLNSAPQSADKQTVFLNRERSNCFTATSSDFSKIPGSPVAYWASKVIIDSFVRLPPLKDFCKPVVGLQTGDNDRFIKDWSEVAFENVEFGSVFNGEASKTTRRWFPYTKGGGFRKWYGNNECVVNWQAGGVEVKACASSVVRNSSFYFKPGLSYTNIGIQFGARATPSGFIFDQKGSMFFPVLEQSSSIYLAFLSSKVAQVFLRILCPTLDFNPGSLSVMPFDGCAAHAETLNRNSQVLIDSGRIDWDAYERSWNFQYLPILTASSEPKPTLESSYSAWITQNHEKVAEMRRLEQENNRLFLDAYGLQDELTPDVPIEQITLTINPAYRYGGKFTEEERWTRFGQDTMAELISYTIGCMMGRYSLDAPGLIYANSGNIGFDASRYTKFPADIDGIVPVTEELWFEDDAALRVREFLLAVWGPESLEQNMAFVADNLGRKASESPEHAIRRYLADKFFKDHLQTYRKRPIYWLFSSGKQGAFQALVYLHRYNAGTLSRLRAEYVVPLTGRMQTKIEELEQEVAASSSTAQRNKFTKQLEKLRQQHLELLAYDEQLRHYADQRITLDLDDGVKVNYGKFGDLLAEVKAVTGGKSDDE